LLELTRTYLVEEYRPHEENLVDIGYHVAGFGTDLAPNLHHIFYGFDRPRRADQSEADYKTYNHSPASNFDISFLYNGRNELAEPMVHAFLNENIRATEIRRSIATASGISAQEIDIALARANQISRYNLIDPIDLVSFSNSVPRFAAEITQEVGPPFISYIISPSNQIATISRNDFSPLTRDEVRATLNRLYTR